MPGTQHYASNILSAANSALPPIIVTAMVMVEVVVGGCEEMVDGGWRKWMSGGDERMRTGGRQGECRGERD